jgi:hypothetical protein
LSFKSSKGQYIPFLLVYVWVLVLEVVGEVLNDETDIVWSEALLQVAFTRSALRLNKVMDVTRYQGFAALISRLNMNIDI